MTKPNQRNHPRVRQRAPVRLQFGGAYEFLRTFTEDISLGGVFVQTKSTLPVGSKLNLTIELGPGKGLRAVGQVMWCREEGPGQTPGIGVRFIEMSRASQDWLRAAVNAFQEKAAQAKPAGTPGAQPAPTAEPPAPTRPDTPAATAIKSSAAPPGNTVRVEGEGREEMIDIGFDDEGGTILGIDLGTSNSCACVVRQGRPALVPLDDPDSPADATAHVLPSVVAFDDARRPTVGTAALTGLEQNPRRTVFGAKRFIGRTYDSPTVHALLSRFPYKIVPDPTGRVAVDINGRPVGLAEISAEILKVIRQQCSSYLGQRIERAVITVPAYYNDNQRAAVVHAGRLAGLSVERVLNEPTAAAIAYGLTGEKASTVLVYDLGGGTFDVSVMRIEPDLLRVLSTAGDTFLGGEDFDNALVEHVCQVHAQKTGTQLSRNSAALATIKQAARNAKQRLSLRDKTMVTVRKALQADNKTCRLEVEVTRDTMEALIKPLVDRTLEICDLALAEAKLEPTALDDIILVGGQTNMPYVRERVREHFQRPPRCDLNPEEVVAMGAGMLSDLSRDTGAEFHDVLSMSIGIAHGSTYKPLLMRNSPVPCSRTVKLQVPRARFDSLKLEVWQGDAEALHQNEHLGSLAVNSVPPGEQDPVSLEIEFSLSADCLLKLTLTNCDTGETQQVLLVSKND